MLTKASVNTGNAYVEQVKAAVKPKKKPKY
jgi:hypothetical protein